MQDSGIPAKFPIPFANSAGSGFIRPIPQASQIGIQNGAASLTDGFPPNCFSPIAGGGSWPFGQDFNGLLKQITQWLQWMQAGGPIQWDSTFSAAIGGYPSGAVVASAATAGLFWRSTADNNTTNPDTGGAGWVPFLPGPQIQTFATSGTFTVPTGIFQVKVTVIGGGGGGGSSSTSNPGGGGGAGGIAVGVVAGLSGTVTVTVGAGGAGGASGGGNSGNSGGASSFGSYLSATGGAGGGAPSSQGGAGGAGGTGTVGAGATGYSTGGSSGTDGSGAAGKGGDGGGPGGGRGVTGNTTTAPAAALGIGGGGGGGGNNGGSGGTYSGGAGFAGIVIVEY